MDCSAYKQCIRPRTTQKHSCLRPEAKRLDINGQELETHPNPGCSTSPPLSTLPSLPS